MLNTNYLLITTCSKVLIIDYFKFLNYIYNQMFGDFFPPLVCTLCVNLWLMDESGNPIRASSIRPLRHCHTRDTAPSISAVLKRFKDSFLYFSPLSSFIIGHTIDCSLAFLLYPSCYIVCKEPRSAWRSLSAFINNLLGQPKTVS